LAALLLAYPASVSAQEDLFDTFEDIFSDDDEEAPAPAAEERRGPKENRGRGRGRGGRGHGDDTGVMNVLDDLGIDQSSGGLAFGGGAVAMVQSITGAEGTGIEALDHIHTGDVINLGNDGELVLEYLDSCRRETVRGGTVTITPDGAQVDGGRLSRQNTQCQQLALAISEDASEAGAQAERVTPNELTGNFWREQVITTTTPTFSWDDKASMVLRIIDLDQPALADIWRATVSGGKIAYPADAPALLVGWPYLAVVQGPGGSASQLFSIDPGLEVGEVLTASVVAIGR
jgi:hypothetical protein